jgi:hypothetical protein
MYRKTSQDRIREDQETSAQVKPYIVVRIPAHRSRFFAGGSYIGEPYIVLSISFWDFLFAKYEILYAIYEVQHAIMALLALL